MKTAMLFICAAFAALAACAKTSTPEGWLDDYEAALKKAAAENKYIIADFSGSDWCGWCKRLDKEVFGTSAFRKGTADKYVLLFIDSPRDQSLLTPETAKQNPELIQKFDIHGFPTVLVLDSTGKPLVRTGYKAGGPEKYLKMIDLELFHGDDIKKYITPIEEILGRYDSEIEEASKKAFEKASAKYPKNKRKFQRHVQKIMFGEVFPKYIPLIEKSFQEAKDVKVPDFLEDCKKDTIGQYEEHFKELKQAMKEYKSSKKTSDEK